MGEAVRRKNGWAARYRDPQSGERLVVPGDRIFNTKAEAEVQANEFEQRLRAVDLDKFDPRTTTLWDYAQGVIAEMRKAGQPQPQSISGYHNEMARCMRPFPIANMLIVQIDLAAIEDGWWKEGILVRFSGMVASQQSARRMMSLVLHHAHPRGRLWSLAEVPIRILRTQAADTVTVRQRRHRLTEEEYELLLESRSPEAHLVWIETAGESGCRPEEVFALIPEQFLWKTSELVVSRAVVWLRKGDAKRTNGGDTVKLSPLTKDKGSRVVPMAPEFMARMRAFIDRHGIQDGELIFSRDRMGVGARHRRLPWVDLSLAEGTVIGPNGREYKHGTPNGRDMGKCRCHYCKAAKRQGLRTPEEEYQARGKDGRILVRTAENDACPLPPWLARFRKIFIRAGIDWPDVEPYDMRHAHAVWLANDPEMTAVELMKRLGHEDLKTTQGYINEARDARNSAAVRNRSRRYQGRLPLEAAPVDKQARIAALLAEAHALMAPGP